MGITKSVTALSRWTLSFNLRSEIAKDTKEMFGNDINPTTLHKETNKSRIQQDTSSENKVLQKLIDFGVFSNDMSDQLRNIATHDQATEEISESLLNAAKNGQELAKKFVQERLLNHDDGQDHKKFTDPMKRDKPATFARLYFVNKADKKNVTLKADRSVLQRLIISYELCKKVICTENYDVPHGYTLLIDGQALVMASGNPQSHMSTTFREFAKVFVKAVFQYGRHFERIAVLFDRYDTLSIKEGTRARRKKGKAIRRVISTPDVPLPHDWQGFLCDPKTRQICPTFCLKK